MKARSLELNPELPHGPQQLESLPLHLKVYIRRKLELEVEPGHSDVECEHSKW